MSWFLESFYYTIHQIIEMSQTLRQGHWIVSQDRRIKQITMSVFLFYFLSSMRPEIKFNPTMSSKQFVMENYCRMRYTYGEEIECHDWDEDQQMESRLENNTWKIVEVMVREYENFLSDNYL